MAEIMLIITPAGIRINNAEGDKILSIDDINLNSPTNIYIRSDKKSRGVDNDDLRTLFDVLILIEILANKKKDKPRYYFEKVDFFHADESENFINLWCDAFLRREIFTNSSAMEYGEIEKIFFIWMSRTEFSDCIFDRFIVSLSGNLFESRMMRCVFNKFVIEHGRSSPNPYVAMFKLQGCKIYQQLSLVHLIGITNGLHYTVDSERLSIVLALTSCYVKGVSGMNDKHFSHQISFRSCEIGEADFSNSTFESDFIFDGTRFLGAGTFNFAHVKVNGLFIFRGFKFDFLLASNRPFQGKAPSVYYSLTTREERIQQLTHELEKHGNDRAARDVYSYVLSARLFDGNARTYSEKWLSARYYDLTEHGRSLFWPVFWLAYTYVMCAVLYLLPDNITCGGAETLTGWIKNPCEQITIAQQMQLAGAYSFKHTVPFLSLWFNAKAIVANNLWVQMLAIVQFAFSSILWFFIITQIRRMFKL